MNMHLKLAVVLIPAVKIGKVFHMSLNTLIHKSTNYCVCRKFYNNFYYV